jgi:hypothetical protein
MSFLNEYAGLISLIGTIAALLAAFAAIFIPIAIERKHNREELQTLQDESNAMDELGVIPMNMDKKQHIIDMIVLKKKLSRKLKK